MNIQIKIGYAFLAFGILGLVLFLITLRNWDYMNLTSKMNGIIIKFYVYLICGTIGLMLLTKK